jgi:hypothetical protein
MTIAQVEARLRAVVEGRGADGSLGPAAQARACVAGRYRTTDTPDPSTLDGSAFDRATSVNVIETSDLIPRNVQCNERQMRGVLEVRIGYAAAPALYEVVHGEPNQAAQQTAAGNWIPRCHDDAREIERALTWYELTGSDTTPVIERVTPLGDTIVTELGNGRGLLTRRFELWLEDTQP